MTVTYLPNGTLSGEVQPNFEYIENFGVFRDPTTGVIPDGNPQYAGAPTVGYWKAGASYIDNAGNLWICKTTGSPGTWYQVNGSGGGGGSSNITFSTGASGATQTFPATISFTHPGGTQVGDICMVYVSSVVGKTWSGTSLSEFFVQRLVNNSGFYGNSTDLLMEKITNVSETVNLVASGALQSLAWVVVYLHGMRNLATIATVAQARSSSLAVPQALGPNWVLGVMYGTGGTASGIPSFGSQYASQIEAHTTTSVFTAVRVGFANNSVAGAAIAYTDFDYASVCPILT